MVKRWVGGVPSVNNWWRRRMAAGSLFSAMASTMAKMLASRAEAGHPLHIFFLNLPAFGIEGELLDLVGQYPEVFAGGLGEWPDSAG